MKNQNRREFIRSSVAKTAVAAGVLAAPAVIAQKKYRWKMITTWPKNFPGLGTGANYLAKQIELMSGGRIQIKVYGGGELVPALGVFDAVSRGTAELGHGAAYYWKGKHPMTQFFGAVPFGLTAEESNGWISHGEGQKLWDELYAPFNLKPFAAGNTGIQMGGWFNKKINTLSDFKGLKIRMPGLGAEVLRRAKATVVTLPGGEIFQALKSGAIDASEWVGPYNDLAFGLYKAAKYYYWPGWHEPGAVLECMINKKIYNELPKDLKTIVRVACEAANQNMYAEYTARNTAALNRLVKVHGVKLHGYSENTLLELGKISKGILNEISGKDSISKRIFASYNKFLKESIQLKRILNQPYSSARAKIFG